MVRRIKEDLREIQGGFPKRVVDQITLSDLPVDTPELRLASLLSEYQEARETHLANHTKKVQAASGLLICGLQQRLFSSIEAFARTLKVHQRTVERQRKGLVAISNPRQSDLDLLKGGISSDDERAQVNGPDLAAEEDLQFEKATAAVLPAMEDSVEKNLLKEMSELAEANRFLPDARVKKLAEWIGLTMCPGGNWNRTRIIIFTEYEDTLRYLERSLLSFLPTWRSD